MSSYNKDFLARWKGRPEEYNILAICSVSWALFSLLKAFSKGSAFLLFPIKLSALVPEETCLVSEGNGTWGHSNAFVAYSSNFFNSDR